MEHRKDHPLRMVYWLAYFWLTFSIIFVGDFQIPQFGYYGFWLIAILGTPFLFRTQPTIFLYAAISGALTLTIVVGLPYKYIDAAYYQAPLFSVIASLYLGQFKTLLESPRQAVFYTTFALLLAFFTFVVLLDSSSSRTSLVFGPTMLYRVILFFYAYCLIYLLHHDRPLSAIIISCIAFYAILKIGSRGGIVAIAAMWLLLLRKYISTSLILKISLALLAIAPFLDWESILTSRAFYFSSDSESTNVRLEKLSMIERFLESKEIWFGMSNPSALVGNYPHNIFAEILIFHGLVAFIVFLGLNILTLYIIIKHSNHQKWIFNFTLLLAPIFIGAQFSGSLIDNYFYISAMSFLITTHTIKYSRANLTSRRPPPTPKTLDTFRTSPQ